MTDPSALRQPTLVIYDFVTGRVSAGHQDDYLAALEVALSELSPATVAPFRRDSSGIQSTVSGDYRLKRWTLGYRVFHRALFADQKVTVLVPNAGPLDFVLLYLASWGWGRPKRGRVAVVMRRDATGIAGAGMRAQILSWIVRRMSRQNFFAMISDARNAADYWEAKTKRNVAVVSIPVRKMSVDSLLPRDDDIRIGLLGVFRVEKGAAHYSDVLELALDADPHVRVECQLSIRTENPREAAMAAQLDRWSGNHRVRFYRGHLDSNEYTQLLYSLDVVVLPYDIASYGPGTSGVLFEALSAGLVVLSTRISWAVREYDHHPNVIWLSDTSRRSLADGIARAVARIRQDREHEVTRRTEPDSFKSTWLAALENIRIDHGAG